MQKYQQENGGQQILSQEDITITSYSDGGAYIKQYINTYGDPKINWNLYDIHHIKPREYGGTNSFDNLMPVLRNPNYNITSWFTGY